MIHYADFDGGYDDFTGEESNFSEQSKTLINYFDIGERIFLIPATMEIDYERTENFALSVPKDARRKIEESIGMSVYSLSGNPYLIAYYFDQNIIPQAHQFMQKTMQSILQQENIPKNTIIIGLVV